MAYLNPGLTIRFRSDFHQDLWPSNQITYMFTGGVQSLLGA